MKIIRKINEARDPGAYYTPDDKVDMDHSGKSPIKVGSIKKMDKLQAYYRIACRKGYLDSATKFRDALISKGWPVPTSPAFPSGLATHITSTTEYQDFENELKKIFEKVKSGIQFEFDNAMDKIDRSYFAIYAPDIHTDKTNLWVNSMEKIFILSNSLEKGSLFRAIKNDKITYDDIEKFFIRDFNLFKDLYVYGSINFKLYVKRLADEGVTFSQCDIYRNSSNTAGRLEILLSQSLKSNQISIVIGLEQKTRSEDEIINDFVLNKSQYKTYMNSSVIIFLNSWNFINTSDNKDGLFDGKVFKAEILDEIDRNAKKIYSI